MIVSNSEKITKIILVLLNCLPNVKDAEPGEGVAREESALEVAVVEEVGEVALEAQALKVDTACKVGFV